jgi:hypothetical protein
MFDLPVGKKEDDIKQLAKHTPHMRYVLKEKYRAPNGPYANMLEKIGGMIYELTKNN